MFTGIVDSTASIIGATEEEGLRSLAIEFPLGFCDEVKRGASISVDGVCLTVTDRPAGNVVRFDVMLQTILTTTLRTCEVGQRVNVERAAREGAEIGGHPLSGHIDFSTRILETRLGSGNKVLRIAIPPKHRRYIFEKGYIAVDGASLTVSRCDRETGWFEVWLIPETRRVTAIDGKVAGDLVNVEIERQTQVVVDTVRATIREMILAGETPDTRALAGSPPSVEALTRLAWACDHPPDTDDDRRPGGSDRG